MDLQVPNPSIPNNLAQDQLDALRDLLATPMDIVITSHRNPDGDAIGSSLAMKYFLEKSFHTVHVMVPSEFPDFLDELPGSQEVLIYDSDPDTCSEYLNKADCYFCLDFNGLDRIDRMGEIIAARNKPTVLVDHHLFPDPFADIEFSDTTASSTCELVYDVINGLGLRDQIDVPTGEALFTGILTDTGSFKYSTSPKLFRIVADLVSLGVDDYKLQDRIFNSMEEKNLRLLGHCLAHRMEILPELRTGIIWLNRADYEHFDIKRGDTEGIVNYLLKMKQIKVAAFIHEQPTITKISLRSKGDFSVQQIAKKHFRGGGHKNASGGASFIGLGPTINKFKEVMAEYREEVWAV